MHGGVEMAYFNKMLKLTPLQARFPITNKDGVATNGFIDLLNRAFSNIENSDNSQGDLLNQIAAILNITNANATEIERLKNQQDATVAENALINSYTDPTAVLSAFTANDGLSATVAVINHNRIYADAAKTTVPVLGKSFPNLLINTVYYLYYDDPARVGGNVDIKFSTNNLDAAQTGMRHSLGSIQTGGANDTDPIDGGGVNPPGGGGYRPNTNIQIE